MTTKTDDLWDELKGPPKPPPIRRKRRRKTEYGVQKEILGWLASIGAVSVVTDAGMLHRAGINAACDIPAGWPDITVCLPGGRFLGLECKSAKGRQSDYQKFIQRRIEDAGGLYVLAHSLAEAQEKIIPFLHSTDS